MLSFSGLSTVSTFPSIYIFSLSVFMYKFVRIFIYLSVWWYISLSLSASISESIYIRNLFIKHCLYSIYLPIRLYICYTYIYLSDALVISFRLYLCIYVYISIYISFHVSFCLSFYKQYLSDSIYISILSRHPLAEPAQFIALYIARGVNNCCEGYTRRISPLSQEGGDNRQTFSHIFSQRTNVSLVFIRNTIF